MNEIMRVFYLVFIGALLLLSARPENLKEPGGVAYSRGQRVVYYFVVGVIAVVSGWYSAIQLKQDWVRLKRRIKNNKDKRDQQ